MPTSYEQARDALYRAPLDTFVQERKRLAAELAQAGDRPGSKQLAKLPRPSVSAWAVNQLYWEAREDFEALFAAAKRVGEGDLSATAEHREATAFLRARAAELLADAGHATTESTLRRVTATLSALAAAGGFEPDAPGTLSGDRDPPGFETALFAAESPAPARTIAPRAPSAPRATITATKESTGGAREEARRRAEEAAKREAEARRAAEERERKRAERKRVEAALITAKGRVGNVTREIERLRGEIARLEGELEQRAAEREKASAELQALEQNLAELRD
jgi:hypothetical protein